MVLTSPLWSGTPELRERKQQYFPLVRGCWTDRTHVCRRELPGSQITLIEFRQHTFMLCKRHVY